MSTMSEASPKHPQLKPLIVEFAGEHFTVEPGSKFVIGREGDLAVDDNRFLHRHQLLLQESESLWWLHNVGSRLSATVTDGFGRVQAWLAPGARLPVVFRATNVVFTAGPTTYEINIFSEQPQFDDASAMATDSALSTLGNVALTATQHLLILSLAEPMLRRDGVGMSDIPTSASAAARLGWTTTRFNRKLDNVCDKLDRAGVPGLRGRVQEYATNRRARLVEHAIAARLVTRADLPLLDQASDHDED